MANPFVKDDNDDVKYLSVVHIIGWSLIIVSVLLLILALFFSVPTMASGTIGFIVMLFLAFGIFVCPVLVLGLFIGAYMMSKSAKEEDDKWIRASKLKYARRMRLIAIFLAIYMVIIYIIHIVVTIGYTLTHP